MFQKKRMTFEIQQKSHDISIPTVVGNFEVTAFDESRTNERWHLGQRHIVTFIGFLNCFLINTNRLVLGVSIVAMVKHGQTNETSKLSASDMSCPLPSNLSKPAVGSNGITIPTVYKLMSNWIPRAERGTLNPLAVCGYPTGVAIGGLVTGWLCDIPGLGWPSAFYVWRITCLVVGIMIHFIYYEHPMDNPWITDEELKFINDGLETKVSKKPPATPWKKIFTSIPAYAYFYGLFGHYWGIAYFLTAHPTFMGTVLHYSTTENGLTSCLPALITTVSGILSSIMSHWISKKNLISLNMLRKTTTAVSAFGFSLCMAFILLAGCDAVTNVLCFALALFFKGIGLAGIIISGVDMAPVFAGSVMGVASNVAAVGSFLVPVATGLLTTHEKLSEWQNVFWLNFGVVGSSGLVYLLFGSAEVQPWNYPEGEHPTEATIEERREAGKQLNLSIEEKLEMHKT